MDVNLQLTPMTRVLLVVLGVVLLVALAMQVGPAFLGIFSISNTGAKQEQLLKTENLIAAAQLLKKVESEIYKDTGLAVQNRPNVATIFEREHPETVIRRRIDALVKRAGVQQNYQIQTKPAPGKQTTNLSVQTRENLVLYLYLKHLEVEKAALEEELATDEDMFGKMMSAWLGEDKPEKDAKAAKEPQTFVALPEIIPVEMRVQLATFIHARVAQELRGATHQKRGFFESQIHEQTTAANRGIFGIGATPASVEVRFLENSTLLEVLMKAAAAHTAQQQQNAIETGTETPDIPPTPLDEENLILAMVEYVEAIQEKRKILVEQLALAPATYQSETYIVEMKFKTDMEKLVKLNRLIETSTKWLSVKDLRIAVEKQQETGARPRRPGAPTQQREATLSVNVLMIARIF